MRHWEDTIQSIARLPRNGRIYVDAGGRGQITTDLRTQALHDLADLVTGLKAEQRAYRELLEAVSGAVVTVRRGLHEST